MIVGNLANAISLLGVLAIGVLFLENGFQYLVPLMIYNNIMDDLDGVVAVQLNTRSEFGAALDNVCDAVAHSTFVLVIGMHYGGVCAVLSVAAVTAILIRIVSRVVPGAPAGVGSSTNELIRHLLFVLLLAGLFSFPVANVLAVVFAFHAVSMLLPYSIPGLIRSRTKSPFSIGLVNVALIVAWLVPFTTVVVALAFGSTYLYGVAFGSFRSLRPSPSTR